MAECMELLNPAAIEEQQEEVTVLQSIFEDDFQMLQGGDGQGMVCFNLTVKVNIPFDRIDFEAFILIPEEFEAVVEDRSSITSGENDNKPETQFQDGEDNATMSESDHIEIQQNGTELGAGSENEIENHGNSHNSFSGRTKPGFSRSLSRRHWHVRTDIQFLTPMHVTCTFPPQYPADCAPEFSLSCLWLTRNQVQELQEKLMSLWTETPCLPIVFTWADWLQNHAYEYLCLGSHLVLKEDKPVRRFQTHTNEEHQDLEQSERSVTTLQTALLTIFEYDLEMQRRVFRQSTHLCEICFDERDGSGFHYLDECRHFFCHDCLKAHCELHVEGGTVLNLLCPSHDCKTMIPPEILQDVLDPDKHERWERLLLSKTLDVMGDIVYCPRCNVAVVVDEDETSRLGHCANCFFAFCTECLETWHARQPCFEEETDSEEEEGAKSKNTGSKKKKDKKREGGAKRVTAAELSLRRQQRLQREKEHRKELSNVSFIRMMKQQGKYQFCPKCRMAVERISGCDMMHCSQCRASFCWRCGMAISGYEHFGHCGKIFHQPRQEPTVGETMIEEYRKANPKRTLRTKLCPRCHQKCLKENNNNNHLKCWACKTGFCYQCGKEIKGAVTLHFTAVSSCMQHSDD